MHIILLRQFHMHHEKNKLLRIQNYFGFKIKYVIILSFKTFKTLIISL